jgi:hypothetical protein
MIVKCLLFQLKNWLALAASKTLETVTKEREDCIEHYETSNYTHDS